MRLYSKNEYMELLPEISDTVGKIVQYKEIYFQIAIGIVLAVSTLAWLKGE